MGSIVVNDMILYMEDIFTYVRKLFEKTNRNNELLYFKW